MKKIELLAPAGSMESLYSAVNGGANAVYLGGSKFSARAYASNFDEANMTKAVDYCHIYGVKVYVTVNTLLKEEELEEALEYTKFLYKIGVDGLIIQDLGLAKAIGREMPDFELHASTQMTIHNLEGAKLLKEMGFKRIVLSRELSLEEIKYISENIGIETEIFVHGALCICYSGQCLMSSMIGGRSGNRGRCAQPCRLPYSLMEGDEEGVKKSYLLSPKDISTLTNIEDIILSGATSLKIEGRMKRPEYVAGVIDNYRKAIDNIQIKEEKLDYEAENKKLLQLFNREGFSKAYLYGSVGKDMMAYNFPKNTGILLGKIDKELKITLKEDIDLKDGVRNGEGGFAISKMTKDNKEVEKAYRGEKVKIYPTNYKAGDTIFKTSDVKLSKHYEGFYSNKYSKKINIPLKVDFKINSPIVISTEIKGRTITVKGEEIQEAIKKPLDKNKIIDSLRKTGDTPFNFEEITFNNFEEGFLPAASINGVRRALLEKVENFIVGSYKRDGDLGKTNYNKNYVIKEKRVLPEKLIYIITKDQLKAVLEFDIKDICINPFMRNNEIDIDSIDGEKVNLYLKIPNIIKGEFQFISEFIEKKLHKIKGVTTANLGIINKFKDRTCIIGDYKLNVFNSESLNFYDNLIDGSCVSVELNKKELENTFKENKNTQMLVYGKIELMVSEYCAIGSVLGGKDKNRNCDSYCNKKKFKLIDRMGEKFLLGTDKFCRSYIYNSVALNLLPNVKELNKIGFKNFRLDFTDENYEEVVCIMKSMQTKTWDGDFKNYTRGHYKRGVE
ncbi:U32 family peptidase [uncultured Clostridium sp.]|uniref:U32 family peptidase n=1 Tax=uncultured Clostridium sp. TaxID=59620 RepID=UPI0028E41139|nr:U32 family peptidase [uncultured Clostridium sp.]